MVFFLKKILIYLHHSILDQDFHCILSFSFCMLCLVQFIIYICEFSVVDLPFT